MRLTPWQRFKAQPQSQIIPVRIVLFNQIDFPLTMPALQLLLAQDRPLHVAKDFVVNETMNLVARRKATSNAISMLIILCIKSEVTPM